MDTVASLSPIAAIGIAILVGIVLIVLNYGWLMAARDKYSAQQRERLRMEDERQQEMTAARKSLDDALSTLRRHVHGEPEGQHLDGRTVVTDGKAQPSPAASDKTPAADQERAGAASDRQATRPDERPRP
ncbi:MAG: hypothetical protein IT305_04395 [Chloroflexi bacterium]|nr:hypothetical protein [Chloroflexota bacterium]